MNKPEEKHSFSICRLWKYYTSLIYLRLFCLFRYQQKTEAVEIPDGSAAWVVRLGRKWSPRKIWGILTGRTDVKDGGRSQIFWLYFLMAAQVVEDDVNQKAVAFTVTTDTIHSTYWSRNSPADWRTHVALSPEPSRHDWHYPSAFASLQVFPSRRFVLAVTARSRRPPTPPSSLWPCFQERDWGMRSMVLVYFILFYFFIFPIQPSS